MKEKKKGSKKYGYIGNLTYMVKEQWKCRKSYIIVSVANAPMAALYSVTAAFLPKIVLDCVENRSDISQMILRIGLLSLVCLICYVAQQIGEIYINQCCHLSRTVFLKGKIFDKIIDMDYNNYAKNETKVMREKAVSVLDQWGAGIWRYLDINGKLLSSIFGFTAFTAIIARCNPWFIPILIVSYAISAAGWMVFQKWKDKRKDARGVLNLKLGYLTHRSKDFASAKDIRIYNMTDFLISKINRHLKEVETINTQESNGHFINVLIEDFLKFVIGLAAYAYLIYLKLGSDMSIGDFVLYIGAITGFVQWLNSLVDSITELVEINHNVNDYRNFLNIPDKMRKEGGKPVSSGDELPCEIELKNVSYTYDEAESPSVDNVSLKIHAGERIAIVGLNGAGKSTLVKLICGLFTPDEGHVLINGIDSGEFNRDDYYTLFSTLFQDCSLLPATIAKNIALCESEKIDRDRLRECMILAGIYEKVESLPQKENSLLIREVHEGATALSGGELQRMLLARAIYKDSPIIILDEPTAALDPIAENNMYLKYSELTKGKTAIYISHRLSSTRFCDKIVLLDDGKIIESGTHSQLLKLGGKYAKMFETQSRYYREEAVV